MCRWESFGLNTSSEPLKRSGGFCFFFSPGFPSERVPYFKSSSVFSFLSCQDQSGLIDYDEFQKLLSSLIKVESRNPLEQTPDGFFLVWDPPDGGVIFYYFCMGFPSEIADYIFFDQQDKCKFVLIPPHCFVIHSGSLMIQFGYRVS